jgi:SAM-dependent methyltransferase
VDIETIKTYNQVAVEFDAETSRFWDNFPDSIIRKFSQSVENGLVLDIGSGPGRDGMLLRQKGLEVVCLDAAKSMAKISHGKNLPSIIADFENWWNTGNAT